MKALILSLFILCSIPALAALPAGPQPPAADVMNGDAQGRAAYLALVQNYLKDWATWIVLRDYARIQNENPATLVLKDTEFTELVRIIASHRDHLGICQLP